MRLAARVALLLGCLLATSSVAPAYYHWIYFAGRTGPFQPVPAKFDLNTIPNRTVQYFVSSEGPTALAAGDSFAGILSQIRLAASAWDQVETSDLRLQFGGMLAPGASLTQPGVEVVFNDDMPPGILAQTYVLRADQNLGSLGTSVPLQRSRVQLRKDLTARDQASYAETFFTTLVHEFGHSLGLQHTLTSSAMSTSVTRATSKARPLSADDIAGISVLYPTADFARRTGSLTGRVAAGGTGINLASVVALAADGSAVSTLTNPDGTYRLDGLAAGSYTVYAHPLPRTLSAQGETTPANIVPPVDQQLTPFAADTQFYAQFFPGTRDARSAAAVNVNAGAATGNINFNVPRANSALAHMQTYGFQGAGGQVAVPSPSLVGGRRAYLAFYADGAIVNGRLAAGLNVTALGSAALVEPASVQFYAPNFVMMIINASAVTAATPVTLAVTLNDDLYVLPAAFYVVPAGAPAIASVDGATDASGNATVNISGVNLSADTRVLFDGAAARLVSANADGTLTVAAPPASGSLSAAVVALSPDGQTSAQQLGTTAPARFTYTAPDNPVISLTPNSVAAGVDMAVEITGFSTNFVDGQVRVGFGTPLIQVRRVWVLDRNRLLVNLSIAANAPAGLTTVTVANGLQLVAMSNVFQIQPMPQRLISLRGPVSSVETGMAGVSAGRQGVVNLTGVFPQQGAWQATIGDARAGVILGGGGAQLFIAVPANVAPGPAMLRVTASSGEVLPPLTVQVDSAPPVVTSAAAQGAAVAGDTPARGGDTITLNVTGLAEADGSIPAANRVRIVVGGVEHVATAVTAQDGGVFAVQFVLSRYLPAGPQLPLLAGVGTRFSAPVVFTVSN